MSCNSFVLICALSVVSSHVLAAVAPVSGENAASDQSQQHQQNVQLSQSDRVGRFMNLKKLYAADVETNEIDPVEKKEDTSDNPDAALTGIYSECVLSFSLPCLQKKFLVFLDRLGRMDSFNILGDFLSVKRTTKETTKPITEKAIEARMNYQKSEEDLEILVDYAIERPLVVKKNKQRPHVVSKQFLRSRKNLRSISAVGRVPAPGTSEQMPNGIDLSSLIYRHGIHVTPMVFYRSKTRSNSKQGQGPGFSSRVQFLILPMFFNSHKLRIKLPFGLSVTDSTTGRSSSPESNAIDIGFARGFSEGRGKKKKMMMMMMMMLKMKMLAVLPIVAMLIKLKALKALILSKMALFLTLLSLLKKKMMKDDKHKIVIIHDPHHGGGGGGGHHDSYGPSSGGGGGGGWSSGGDSYSSGGGDHGGGWGRSWRSDAQDLAYRGQRTNGST
ncbi:hypothetical protein RUM43_013223 [Polyplax serrata]|uniref:Uncharacterized protein n=1 Tax=Polyplax serrata TaxID=468196 RepID=A0AAN8S315_POLSC